MRGLERKGFIEKNAQEKGVLSPENPVKYISDLFKNTPDFVYTAADIPDQQEREKRQNDVRLNRKRLEAAVRHLPEIGHLYAKLLRTFCNELQLDPGKIRVYLVGGRVYEKPLMESSDFDLVLTVENPNQGLQATSADSWEQASKKRARYKDWSNASLAIGRQFGLNDQQEDFESSLLEPKGMGLQTDAEFIADHADANERRAVLLYSE